MNLTNQATLTAMDPVFGELPVNVGQHAWSIAELTMREKAFIFVAADLCAHGLGFPLSTHVEMARSQGVSVASIREAVRHLAPYVGYPTAAEALMRLAELEDATDTMPDAGLTRHHALDSPTLQLITKLDAEFADFFQEQFINR